jgi:hypothetical protein
MKNFNEKENKQIAKMAKDFSIEDLIKYAKTYQDLIDENRFKKDYLKRDLQLIDEAIARKSKDESYLDILDRWRKL